MDALNSLATISLPSECCQSFYGIAFDGRFFYLTAREERSIYKLKRDFSPVNSIETDKQYNCICYDNTENCFWVTEKKHNDVIHKLDCKMREIGLLRVNNCRKPCSIVTGLSYDCEKDTLLAAYKDHIVEVSKESGITRIIMEVCEGFYKAILSIAPYYAAILKDEKGQSFQIFSRKWQRVKTFCIPDLYTVKDVLFYPCTRHCQDELEFILLATKADCCQSILLKINICGMILCACNYKVCCTENEQCICDLIESVALVETSLAHILNAEGEKLQKAVEVAKSVDELLEINKSVTKTIISVAHLEHQLYLKLDALS